MLKLGLCSLIVRFGHKARLLLCVVYMLFLLAFCEGNRFRASTLPATCKLYFFVPAIDARLCHVISKVANVKERNSIMLSECYNFFSLTLI